MENRGQITIFVIIAIVLVAAILVFFGIRQGVFSSSDQSGLSAENSEARIASEGLEGCAKSATQEALITIGERGGYFNAPNRTSNFGDDFLSYHYYSGEFQNPTLSLVESELAKYVDFVLPFCAYDLNNTAHASFNFKDVKTKAKINAQNVVFDIQVSGTYTKGNVTSILRPFSVKQPSYLSTIISYTDYIALLTKQDPTRLCASCLSEEAQKKGLYLEIVDYAPGERLFDIAENKSNVEGYLFRFVNKYTK